MCLARPLYFEGNCVVLDHGQGTAHDYMHLSEFKVKEGEQVARGQEVGLSGGLDGPRVLIFTCSALARDISRSSCADQTTSALSKSEQNNYETIGGARR